ncbi:MAG: hypothetical protein RL383_178 [Actinomycetota bacterium]|jgi:creatinine amidohydrolase
MNDPMAPLLVVPLGSHEQHGAHLPHTTDSVIISAVVEAACAGRDAAAVTVAPAVGITASDEHEGFPGTVSIGTELTAATIVAIVRSAGWSRGVLFANGHGGNADALAIAGEELAGFGTPHDVWSLPFYDGADLHAGLTETSVMLHLRPDLVRMDLATAGNTSPVGDLMDAMRAGGVRAVSPNGVLGDPSGATERHGRSVFGMWVTSLSSRIDALLRDPGK